MKSIYFKYHVCAFVIAAAFCYFVKCICLFFLFLAGGNRMTFICILEILPNSNHIQKRRNEGRTEVKFFELLGIYTHICIIYLYKNTLLDKCIYETLTLILDNARHYFIVLCVVPHFAFHITNHNANGGVCAFVCFFFLFVSKVLKRLRNLMLSHIFKPIRISFIYIYKSTCVRASKRVNQIFRLKMQNHATVTSI